jgi:cell division protein FtsB
LNRRRDDATVVARRVAQGSLVLHVTVPASGAANGVRTLRGRGDLTARVEVPEEKVAALEELPARVASLETQIVQLRTEMSGEFSAVRHEMRALTNETRAEIQAVDAGLRAEMRTLEQRLGTQMRVLHEEVIERIARLDDGQGSRYSKRSKRC